MSTSSPANNRLELDIRGMHCAGCVATVEAALRRVPGVAAASVNLATEHATVWLAAESPPPPRLLEVVKAAGYEAQLAPTTPDPETALAERAAELRRQRNRLLLALLCGLPVLAWHLLGPASAMSGLGGLVLAALTTATVFIVAGPMMAGAARALAARSANMDLLVSLGALTALVSSLIGVATHTHELMLFDAAVMIVLFVALGKHLEARARGRASAALFALFERVPRTALRAAGDTTEAVSVDAIRPGDLVRVPAHTPVPVDGEVVSGHATVDEALLTGESLPVERTAGQRVFGGTHVLDGLLEMRATATGRDSAVARIAQLVAEAQASKPPWQRLADRAAAVFVPAVIVLALASFIGWKWVAGAETFWALQRMIAVLVVACPCALGLAIPTAVLVGTARAADHGILVRDATALEAAGRIQEVLLDKTGTLTIGRPALVRWQALGDADESAVLRAAAGVEQLSEHPLARAIVAAAGQRGITPPMATDLRSHPGGGIRGVVDGTEVIVGSADWLRENSLDPAPHGAQADALSADGFSVVWVALDRRIVGLLGFADPLHPESALAVARLRAQGIRVRILSGDRLPAVRRVAALLGIENYEAELTPGQKLQRVRELATSARTVAMVGDGINDAPALAAAQVGIAIGAGADVAREAADICLVGHSPRLIADAIRLSRASARVMKQNLFWAVAYNVVMLPVAMLTPLPPALATVAMMFSSLSVVGNALRLRRVT